MKIVNRVLGFLIALFILVSAQAFAADYYVDPGISSGGNGSSWATAWKSVNWSTLNSGTNTVYLSGGPSGRSYGSMTVEHTGSGVLTIRPGSASPSPSGHSGLVTFGSITWGSANYVRNTTISGENTIGGGQINMRATSIHNMASSPNSPLTQVNCKILYMELSTGSGSNCANHCLDLTADSKGWEIGWNNFNGCQGGAVYANNYVSHSDTAFGDNSIHHNRIYHTGNDGLEAYYGGWDIYNNEFIGYGNWAGTGDCHGDSVSAQLAKTRIFNNTFHDYTQEVFISMFGAPLDGLYIYNNVFYWSGVGWTEPGILIRNTNRRTTMSNFRIVNNLFNMNGDVGNIVFSMSAGEDYGVTWTNSVITNNIFTPTTASNFYLGEGGGQTQTYSNTDMKIYRNVYEESSPKSAWHETWYTTVPSWNTVTGATGNNANKQCSVSLVNRSGRDYHLQPSDTCAKGQGIDLSTYGWTDMGPGWGKDKDGVARQAGAWSIGPYEIAGPSPSIILSPPGDLRVIQ